MVAPGHREEREDHRDDEDVVHRERLLDREAGQILHAGRRAELPPHPDAEADAERHVTRREHDALAHADLAMLAVEHAEIEDQQQGDDRQEAEPHPQRLGQPGDEQEVGQDLHGRSPRRGRGDPRSRTQRARRRGPVRGQG
jgi:hypothetical protein